jgi:hypothetical protein
MNRACSTIRGEEESMYDSGEKTRNKDVGVWTILKLILKR